MKVLLQVIEKRSNGDIYEPLGSDNQFIINDLKTLRGILSRIRKYNINHSKSFRLYQFNDLILDSARNRLRLIYEYNA